MKTDRNNLRWLAVLAVAPMLLAAGNTANALRAGNGASTPEPELSGTITVWDVNLNSFEGYTEAAEQLDAMFEERYGVEVDHVAQPFGEYDQILQAAFAGQTGPDVMMLVPGRQGVLRWVEGLEELTENVEGFRDELAYWESASPDLTTDGPVYGVPIGTQADVFYYNKALFEEAGLDPEDPPTTWDELISAADQLKEAGITPFASGNQEGYENQWWLSILWAGLHDIDATIALGNGDIPIDSDEMRAVLERYLELQDAGYFPEDRFSIPLFTEGVPSFSEGEGAMFLGLSDVAAHWGVFNEALGADNVGIFEAPGITGDEPAYYPVTATYEWAIPTFADNKDAAWAYIEFMASAEAQQLHYDIAQSFPNHRDVDLGDAAPPQLVEMIEHYQSHPTYQSVHQLLPGVTLTEWTNVINEVLQGRQSVDDALAQIDEVNRNAG